MSKGFKDLIVYQKAFKLANEIYQITKEFPKEERYALTGQIRRSSRSVCVNIAEGYRKRQYEAYFVNKMSDADMENSEKQVWLDFAFSCEYISCEIHDNFTNESKEIGRLLNHMVTHPEKYRRKSI